MELKASDISKILKVSRAAITIASNAGKIIKNQNNKYDLENAVNANFLSSRGVSKLDIEKIIFDKKKKNKSFVKPENIEKNKIGLNEKEENQENNDCNLDEEKENIDPIEFEEISGLPAKMMKLTLSQLVRRYGGAMMLKTWADILNKIMTSNEKDQRIQERRQELVSKDFVISRIFQYLEVLNNQFFDFPAQSVHNSLTRFFSITTKIVNQKVAEEIQKKMKLENIENILEAETRELISQLLKEAKKNINRELESIKKRHSKEENTLVNKV